MLASSRQMSLNCVFFFFCTIQSEPSLSHPRLVSTDSYGSLWQRRSQIEDRPFEVDGCAQPSLYSIWSVSATHAHIWPQSVSEVLGNDLCPIHLLSGSFFSHTELKIEPNPLENNFIAPGILALEQQLFTFSCCKEPFLVYSSWKTQLVSTGRCFKSSSITVRVCVCVLLIVLSKWGPIWEMRLVVITSEDCLRVKP